MKKLTFALLTLLLVACNSDDSNDSNDSQIQDSIIGTWAPFGVGTVLTDGTDEFSEFDNVCFTIGRFAFESDGSFRLEAFDGPGVDCFSTGVATGTWENLGQLYRFVVLTDTSDNPQTGEQIDVQVEFPNNARMEWFFESDTDGVDSEYEVFTKLD